MTPIKAAITAAVVGMAEKSGVLDNLPEIPVVGRKGVLAIVAYYWARHGGGPRARAICTFSFPWTSSARFSATACGAS